MTNEEKFTEWLKSTTNKPLKMPLSKDDKGSDIYIKVAKTDQFEYLYRQRVYGSDEINRYNNFEYAGIYNKLDETLYDYVAYYDSIMPTNASERTSKKMLAKMKGDVWNSVERIIGNDRRNLLIEKLSEKKQEELAEFKKYFLSDKVRKMYLEGIPSEGVCYKCKFEFMDWDDADWKETDLLNYISDQNAFVKRQVNDYLSANQEEILLQFKENDLLKEGLQELERLEDGELYRLRMIMQVMNSTSAKTVNVTINRDGQELTFKTEASDLRRDPNGTYSYWRINSKDRDAFEEMFGRYGGYRPEEITEITYCGKSLYAAEPMEDHALAQGLKLT